MSPKYYQHRRHFTPPSKATTTYDSPMLTPSPLRGRPLFALSTNIPDSDDTMQSPYKSPALAPPPGNPFFSSQPQTILADDEEGHIFLSTATAAPVFSASTSQPLLTPAKSARRVASRSKLPSVVAQPLGDVSRGVGLGTKRKSTANTTPLRPVNITPLKLTPSNGVSLDRLAPPKFTAKTPQSKADTDAYLSRQTATLTHLRISDPDVDFDAAADDSGCEMDESGHALSPTRPKYSAKAHQPRALLIETVSKGKEKEEVAEAISPGGHISKRRARSRPVSAELLEKSLLEKALKSPKHSPKPVKQSGIPCRVGGTRPRHSGPVAFPTTSHRGRASPASSSSEAGSPRPRRRISAGPTAVRPSHLAPLLPRPQLSRITSGSSASLFFGPAIPLTAPASRSRTNNNLSSDHIPPIAREPSLRPNLTNRHSYTGPSNSTNWNARDISPSPGSSPFSPAHGGRHHRMDMDEEEDTFFGGEESSFVFNLIDTTPPQGKAIPKKFKARDSLTISDDEDMPSFGSSTGGDYFKPILRESTSVSSVSDDGLVTPGFGPDAVSGWPAPVFINDEQPDSSVDIFIQKTLAEASKASAMPKRAPGTPVKKARVSYFGHERPWQSAVAPKVGLKDDCDFKKVPRKSLPAAFPATGAAVARTHRPKMSTEWQPTDTEDEYEYSPSTRKDKYTGLGLGQPTSQGPVKNGVSSVIRLGWPGVLRRSSSGAFSSGSDASLANTPTRTNAADWQLPRPRIPLRISPSNDAIGSTSRSASGSSSSSIINSPTTSRTSGTRLQPSSVINTRRFSDTYTEEELPGRFERDFDEIEEVGSGEFGKVMKVRSKNGDDGEMYAVKKSKRFEGVKHRLRLREEVDILKHLSLAALSHSYANGRHPNVLGYIDNWEEDEALYIRTELCDSGNLARFLWEYGRVFPRLDEARVWKIVADLSNGLRFIHDSGAIHLDLKPSNVFVTKEGRFKIGDFGMASLWPRPVSSRNATEGQNTASESGETRGSGGQATGPAQPRGFEREGDKLYLAPEVLQGRYGKAADIFSFGMTILETASNIVVPDQGEAWHRLRNEDFSQVDLDHESESLVDLIRQMMRTDPSRRLTIAEVWSYPPVSRARAQMDRLRFELGAQGKSLWGASPLASVPEGFLREILSGEEERAMDTSA